MGKKGLWANMHAKRKRGESPAKPGDKDYPTDKALKDSAAKMLRGTPKKAGKKKEQARPQPQPDVKGKGAAKGKPMKPGKKKPIQKVGNTIANVALQVLGARGTTHDKATPFKMGPIVAAVASKVAGKVVDKAIDKSPFKMKPSPSALKCWKGYKRDYSKTEFSDGSCVEK